MHEDIAIQIAKQFPERAALAKVLANRNDRAGALLNPYALELEKYKHPYEKGQRVKIVAPLRADQSSGHAGVISDIADAHIEVRLDSGHTVHVQALEIAPENFDHDGDGDEANKLKKSALAVGDRVRSRFDGRKGKVTKIGALIDITFDDGMGSASCAPDTIRFLYERV
jgi:hypothetical protein